MKISTWALYEFDELNNWKYFLKASVQIDDNQIDLKPVLEIQEFEM